MAAIAGKTIVITGASSGIGRATALALARERTRLTLVARRQDLLEEVEGAARSAGAEALSLPLDLREERQVEEMIRRAAERFGRIDVLINNAGFGYFGTVEATPPEVIRDILALNFEAPLRAIQRVIPIMKAQGGGHIVNVSSVGGRRGLPLSGVYSATKFALHGLSESLRLEVKDAGIRVSVIHPGSTRTEFFGRARRGDVEGEFKPMGRVQSAEEVAESIVACVQAPRSEVYPYRISRALVWVNAIAPGLVDRVMARYLRDRLSKLRIGQI